MALWICSASLTGNVPYPWTVASSLGALWSDGELSRSILSSLGQALAGYLAALGVGIPLGMAMGRKRTLRDTVGILVDGLGAMPSVCWLPLAVAFFGMSARAIPFMVFAGSLAGIVTTVRDGVQSLPLSYFRAAHSMGAQGRHLLTDVFIPASLPSLLRGAKVGWRFAWRATMAGEFLIATAGLGSTLLAKSRSHEMAPVFAVMLVIVATGLVADRLLFGTLERRVRARWGAQAV